jgi:hypothetical protein
VFGLTLNYTNGIKKANDNNSFYALAKKRFLNPSAISTSKNKNRHLDKGAD